MTIVPSIKSTPAQSGVNDRIDRLNKAYEAAVREQLDRNPYIKETEIGDTPEFVTIANALKVLSRENPSVLDLSYDQLEQKHSEIACSRSVHGKRWIEAIMERCSQPTDALYFHYTNC